MSDWGLVEFQGLAHSGAGSFSIGPFGSAITTDNYVSQGVPVVRGVNLAKGIFVDDEFVYITDAKADELARSNLIAGDLVFTHRGTIGQVSMIPRSPRFRRYVLSSSQVKARLDSDRAVPEFYYYWFRSPEGQRSLLANASVVGVPGIGQPLATIRSLEVPHPPLEIQKAVSSVLGALDDKIAINGHIMQKLDVLTREIFHHDFLTAEADRAPRDWREGTLADICATQYGYTASSVKEASGPKFLRVKDINKQNWIEWDAVPHCEISEPERSKYSLAVGDVVVARMADPGKSAIIEAPVDAVFASYLVRLKTESLAHSYYIYGFLKSDDYTEYSASSRSGSVQANMNAKVIVGARIRIPPTELLEAHLARILPLRRKLMASLNESATLTQLRDALLPRLMSGEIRVRDAEKVVEDVT